MMRNEEQNLFLMEKIIDWEEIGFRVCGLALDGQEGIQVYEETQPDVVFVDIRMEEMDGLTLIQELKKRGRESIYVIVTAYGEFSYAQKAISLGVKNYLLKPLARKEMIPMMQEIRKILDERTEKEQEEQSRSRQYGNNLFARYLDKWEVCCLKGEALEAGMELETLIDGRTLRSVQLISPWEDTKSLIEILKGWNMEYIFPGYDCVYGIISDEEVNGLICRFEALKAGNIRKKYSLIINRSFSDRKSFQDAYQKDFSARHCCFYQENSLWYRSEEIQEQYQGPFHFEEGSLEEAEKELLYNASAEKILKMLRDKTEEAKENRCAPGTMADAMIELLISIKNRLTEIYGNRAFMVLRHQNLWDLHRIKTEKALYKKMEQLMKETESAVQNILDHKDSYTLSGRTMEFIQKNYTRTDFSAAEAAEAVHLSRNYFLKIFKEEQGISFWDHVTKLRMEKARKMLKNTEETIYTISREIGYESQYHFSRKFKNIYGISPNEYRNL